MWVLQLVDLQGLAGAVSNTGLGDNGKVDGKYYVILGSMDIYIYISTYIYIYLYIYIYICVYVCALYNTYVVSSLF